MSSGSQSTPPTESAQRKTPGAMVGSADDLLVRGNLVLQSLTKQVEAARAEARKTELELILAAARRGDTERLRTWLSEHDRWEFQELDSELNSGASLVQGAAESDTSETAQGDLVESPESPGSHERFSWDDFSGHATRRLAVLAEQWLWQGNSEQSKELPDQQTADTPELKPDRSDDRPELAVKSLAVPSRDAERLAALAQSFASQKPSESQQEKSNLKRLSGVVASILVHVLLILTLAVVTLKMPSPPAGLALESASAQEPQPSLELTKPVEAQVPDVSEPEESQESNLDFAEELADIDSSMTNVLGQTPLASEGLASSSLAASAAGTASANPMQASASFFGAAAGGNCFCYVIDSSGSMRGGAWEAAKQELLKSLSSLKPKQRFYLIFFNRELSAITLPGRREPAPSALYATQENLEHASRWIDTIKMGIGAPPSDALEMAIGKEPDAIYLLTDGVTTVDVAKFLREQNRITDFILGEQILVPIHTIAFYSLKGQDLLQQIASENGGQFIYVPDPKKR